MAVTTFIPKLWEARLLANLDKAHVYAGLVNRDYEGTISGEGDRVSINSIGPVTIKKYSKNTKISDPEVLSTTEQELIIDQADYFNFSVDDVDARQAAGNLVDPAMQRAAYGMSDASDVFLAGLLAKGTANAGLGVDATPIALTSDNAYAMLVKMRENLNKANLPMQGRWVVVPPEFTSLILMDDRFSKTGGPLAENTLVSGWVAKAAGFDIYESNNVPVTAGKFKIIGSSNMTASYAEQISKTEAYRPDNLFADAVKGLHVYGAKVTRPTAVSVLTATFGAEAGA